MIIIIQGKRIPHNKKTHEQFINDISKTKNPNIKILGKYINSKTKIECLCLICNNIYYASPNSIKNGYGHQKCSNIKRGQLSKYTHTDFLNRMKNINPFISFTSEYTGTSNKIDCHCEICEYNWSCYPGNLYKGAGCPKCADIRGGIKRKQRQSIKYIKELEKLNVTLIENYIDCYTPILHKCNICGSIWKTDPHHMLSRGSNCPTCYGSSGEQKIGKLLSSYNIYNITQKNFEGLIGINGGLLTYDFYLPDYNKLIEFQGIQHEKAIEYFGGEEKFKIQQEHDRRKKLYAKDHNIELIEIWYYDYSRIEEILINELNLKSVETVEVA